MVGYNNINTKYDNHPTTDTSLTNKPSKTQRNTQIQINTNNHTHTHTHTNKQNKNGEIAHSRHLEVQMQNILIPTMQVFERLVDLKMTHMDE